MKNTNRIRVRELRAKLAQYLNCGGITVVGDDYHIHAFIVSLPPSDSWATSERNNNLRKAAKEAHAAILAELK